MNAIFTVIPILLIRYGLLGLVNKNALKRAALFAPIIGKEKAAFWVYQITTILILVYLFFLKINFGSKWFYAGIALYSLGIVLYAISTISYAKPDRNGMNLTGVFKISRNPMYVAYFIIFLGCAVLTESWILFGLLIIFQISAHWIILSEERWCMQQFGEEYKKYMDNVRRYI